MNQPQSRRSVLGATAVVVAGAVLLFVSFQWNAAKVGANPGAGGAAGAASVAASPLRIALAAVAGATELDGQISAMQGKVRERSDLPHLERLAALFISKARTTGDPGYYKQADACAETMATFADGAGAAALVHGHVRHALHDFAAAEAIARKLVADRGMFLDHGLLGDVLLDLGRLEQARESYQKMLDIKPCLQSYARAAQVRWLIGDIAGSRELLAAAAASGSQRDPESKSWVYARCAGLELQVDDAAAALQFADQALGLTSDYPAALLVRGRAALALGKTEDAVTALGAAAAQYPLPEHLWGHADALRLAGRLDAARVVESQLLRTGEREDPRTLALWLATTGKECERAHRLAKAEYAVRQDVHTLDVLALARLRTGDLAGAREAMQRALSVGIADARIALHAALIAEADSDMAGAAMHVAAARRGCAALWPSERRELDLLSLRL